MTDTKPEGKTIPSPKPNKPDKKAPPPTKHEKAVVHPLVLKLSDITGSSYCSSSSY
jgi:hypothetical protein